MAKPDILIIDDDKNICEIMASYCEELRLSRTTVIARDGSLGTLKLQNQIFGLIILDMNMPKKGGLEVLNEFVVDKNNRNRNKIENVLVISGNLDRELIPRIIQKGVKHFLTKPFDEASFKEKVTKMLQKELP